VANLVLPAFYSQTSMTNTRGCVFKIKKKLVFIKKKRERNSTIILEKPLTVCYQLSSLTYIFSYNKINGSRSTSYCGQRRNLKSWQFVMFALLIKAKKGFPFHSLIYIVNHLNFKIHASTTYYIQIQIILYVLEIYCGYYNENN